MHATCIADRHFNRAVILSYCYYAPACRVLDEYVSLSSVTKTGRKALQIELTAVLSFVLNCVATILLCLRLLERITLEVDDRIVASTQRNIVKIVREWVRYDGMC